MQKTDTLIRTKLHLPFTRPGLVSRPRLQEQIKHGLSGPLTLITAPAGFGKTTLVATCVVDCGMPVAWLSLDKDDNQEERFYNYLVAALQKADHSIGIDAAQLLAALPQAPVEAVLTSLINDLDSAGREIALVLDDYQFISGQAVHETVAFLLDHCPNTFHLLIASRSDPSLPISRLRARGQMMELRAADLCFTESEAAQFLNDVMGLRLDAESVSALEERTEGWIAGLQMAALSMQNREDVIGFIQGFSGTHRYILDYLLEEVLIGQPPEVQRFLLYTSILNRLTAPLCNAVLTDDSEAKREDDDRPTGLGSLSIGQSASTLAYLERTNLFLVPLDDESIWYRYHHLFADLLRARLDQIYPGLAPQLHLRAATWLEQAGMTVEAINHALAAGAHDHAARLVEENTTRLLAQGEMNALMGWIETLPAEVRLARPWLCIHQAYALAFAGRLAEVPPLLVQAQTAFGKKIGQGAPDISDETDKRSFPRETAIESRSPAEEKSFTGAIEALRAMAAVMTGHEADAILPARHARELLPAEDLWNRSSTAWALGYALRSQGNLPEACAAFEEMVLLARSMKNIWSLTTGLTDQAQVLRAQGKMRQSRALLEEALAEASQQGDRKLGFIARPEAQLAIVLYEQNELGEAHRLLSDALTHARFCPNPNHIVVTYSLLALVLLAEGDLSGAWRSIGEADQIRESAALTHLSQRHVGSALVRVWLAFQASGIQLKTGDPLADQADALLAAWQIELADSTKSMDEASETAALTLTRVALATGRFEDALSLLERVTNNAHTAGHINVVIPSLVLTAIAYQADPALQGKHAGQARGAGQIGSALAALEEALILAEPGGYVRVFIDEDRPMKMLLAQWLAHASAGSLRNYATHLLSQFDAKRQNITTVQGSAPPVGDLVDPLSQRELEVLHLMALGRTNQEIAQQLIVARGTVKAHTANIYRKLDVANRTEAVARARQLGLFP
jgi:LuxR family maltose regulon positive regulatory protein